MLKDPIESPNQLCRQPEQVCANVALIAGLGILFSLGQSQWRNIETNDTGVWRCHRDCPHIVAKPASRNQNVAGERAVSSHPGKQRRCRRPFLPRHFANSVEFVPVGHVIGYRLQDVVKTSVTLSEVLGFCSLVLQYEASGSRPGPNSDYTVDDLRSLVSVNIEGFLFISQFAIKQMLAQKTRGSSVNITSTPVIPHWTPLQMRSRRWFGALSVLDVESGHVLTRKAAIYAI